MIDPVGTTDVTVARVIVGHANVIGERETEAHVHAKRSRINRCGRRAECCSAWRRQASTRHSFVRGQAEKSVAMEYYRPNIEDCGEAAVWLK
jgi:hypothetical protein